jgi:hypothetical protein
MSRGRPAIHLQAAAIGLAAAIACAAPAHAQSAAIGGGQPEAAAPVVRWSGDARPGFHGAWRTSAAGAETELHELRARVRMGLRATLSPRVELGARAAGRFSSEQDGFRLWLRDRAPSPEGLAQGDVTVDELFARVALGRGAEVRAGRIQTSFELAGVPRKSLDRNDSPNVDVTWTDGVHLSIPLSAGVRQHLVVQHNPAGGPTNTLRRPLDFTDPGSRVSVWAAVSANPARGLVAQRELGVTVLPSALPRADGSGTATYAAVVGRGALRAPVGFAGATLMVAAEAGYAPTTPSRTQTGTGTAAEGSADGRAGQISANLMNAWGAHSLGVVHGRAGDGWLLSSDIRPNNREWEIRYYWQYAPWGRLDARVRAREDARPRAGESGRRSERDVYFRTTLRF